MPSQSPARQPGVAGHRGSQFPRLIPAKLEASSALSIGTAGDYFQETVAEVIRITTTADMRFRDRAANLARSLETSPNDYCLTVYCDDGKHFRELEGPRCRVVELPEIKHLGAKRAKPTVFASALREGSFIYLDADAIVLENLDEFWGGDQIRGCADDLECCPFIEDKSHPWSGDPALINRCYINSGGFFAPVGRFEFFERLRAASLNDNLWRKYTLEGYLYDNHFLCAFLNLLNEPVELVDPEVYGWRGFLKAGQLQAYRSGSHLLNKNSGKMLKLVLFAGVQQSPEMLRSLPLDVAALLHERIAAATVNLDNALTNLYACLSSHLENPPADLHVSHVLQAVLTEIPQLARACKGELDLGNRSSYFADCEAIKAVAFAPPNPDQRTWNGLQCGGAYLEGDEYSRIRAILRALNIKTVLETGAGESSILFRRLQAETCSIEYQQGPWAERAAQLGCKCLFVDFDYQHQRFDDSQLSRQFAANPISEVDLLFIDSPVGTKNRRDIASQLLAYIQPRFVLYHDALRDSVNIFRDQARYGWKAIDFLDSPRGLALFAVSPDEDASLPEVFDPDTVLSEIRSALMLLQPDPLSLTAGERRFIRICLRNNTQLILSSRYRKPVHISYHWLGLDGATAVFDGERTFLPFDLEPGDTAEFSVKIVAPAKEGEYLLKLAIVQELVTWFDDACTQAPVKAVVGPATA